MEADLGKVQLDGEAETVRLEAEGATGRRTTGNAAAISGVAAASATTQGGGVTTNYQPYLLT